MTIEQAYEQVRKDLRYAWSYFPLESLLHLRANRRRLIRNHYRFGGSGCMFYLLSEPLSAENRIDNKAALTRFFTGGSGDPYCELVEYQPARHLVYLIDGHPASARYGELCRLEWSTMFAELDQVIAERQDLERAEAEVRRQVLARSAGQFDWLVD